MDLFDDFIGLSIPSCNRFPFEAILVLTHIGKFSHKFGTTIKHSLLWKLVKKKPSFLSNIGILRIFYRNESMLCLCLIWLSVLIIYDVTFTAVIMSELHHFTSLFSPVICVRILLYVFVMHNSVWMTIHIIICLCNAQLCTNDCFIPNFFPMRFCKMGIFSCFLAYFSSINRWGRAPWCLFSLWWVLMPFLLKYFGFTICTTLSNAWIAWCG